MAKPFALLKSVMVERIGVRGKERGRIATAYSFPRKNFRMNALLLKEKYYPNKFKKYIHAKPLFESVSRTPKPKKRKDAWIHLF